jgi:hypothetical protein
VFDLSWGAKGALQVNRSVYFEMTGSRDEALVHLLFESMPHRNLGIVCKRPVREESPLMGLM